MKNSNLFTSICKTDQFSAMLNSRYKITEKEKKENKEKKRVSKMYRK